MWTDAPRITAPPQTDDINVLQNYVKNLANVTAKMAKELEFILNGNVAFDNVRANGIEAKNIKAESITSEKIQAGAVTADKISVNELSAISANLGHIVAGLIESVNIYGSYIATSQSYPRVEMSNTFNMMGAYRSPDNHIQIYSPDDMFSPVIKFETPLGEGYVYFNTNTGALTIGSNDFDINLTTSKRVNVDCSEGFYVNGVNISS
jgi:hypothetical protein